VFPGLGDAAPAETEFVSDELDPEALREVRTTARRMERQRERLESMQIGADEQPPAEAEEMPKASETAQKAPDTAPDAAPEKAEDGTTEDETEKKATEPEPAAETSSASQTKNATAASGGNGLSNANDAYADDYQSSPYADDPYGDGGGAASLMDMLAALNGGGDTREEVHAPAAKLDAQTRELLRRTSSDRKPDTSGRGELEMGYLRYPNLVGETLVFVSEGNIWVGSAGGGAAARVSASYSVEALPKLSPDGKTIAFLAQSIDGYEVFTVPVAGGVTTRVSYGSAAVKLEGWTRNGHILVVTTFFSPVGTPQLATVNPLTKNMEVLPFARAAGGTQDEQGCYVFYPLRQTSSTKRYEGGEQSRLWRWCEGDDEAKLLTDEAWTKRGAWSPRTTPAFPWTVFFISDKNGVANVWSMKLDGSEKTQITFECGMDVMEFDLDAASVAADGFAVGVARVGGSLRKFKVGHVEGGSPTGPSKNAGALALMGNNPMNRIPITLVSEFRESAVQKLRFPLEELREVALSEDGMYAALVIRGQIFFTPLLEQLGSRIEQVTGFDGAVRYRHAQFVRSEHPEDPTKILAMSDASGEYEYVLLERLAGADTGGLWNETQLTSGGSIKGVMSYSSVSPDSSSLVFDDTYGRISVLNLSSTAVNTFDFKTTPDAEGDGANAQADQMAMLTQLMQGAPAAALGGVTPLGRTRGVGEKNTNTPRVVGEKNTDTDGPTNDKDAAKLSRARERSKLRRKRRAFRRESRSRFRRDWRLAHSMTGSSGPRAPLSSSPRAFAGFEGFGSDTKPRARDMHHTRYGQPPSSGGFSDLFGAHLGAAGPAPAGAAGTASARAIMSGLRPEAAGDYSWSPDGKWLAFSATDETEFSTVNVWRVDTGEVVRLTHPSYNAVEPKFSPDGFFLYYFSDQQIESGADSPYGSRGSEPTIVGSQQLMCLPLREGFKCPFFLGDELNPQGQIFDPEVGKKFPTKISVLNIEKRAAPVPFLEKAQYADLHIVNGGQTFVMQMWDGVGFYLIAMDIMTGAVVPIYPDPLGVYVSGDGSVLMIAVEQGLALFSAKALAVPEIDQDALLGSAAVWAPPESWAVTVNPRAEWMQMYNDAMRNMRDAFYDPDMHGVDWQKVTETYRPLVYQISTKAELRDVLQQALGELSVLHVFVSIRSESPTLPVGEPSACLGGSLVVQKNGLEVVRVYDTSGVLAAPDSPLSAAAVDLRPGDVVTRVDGVFLNATAAPLSRALLGKAGMQVLLEVDQKPREAEDDDESEIVAQLQGGLMGMMPGGAMMPPGAARMMMADAAGGAYGSFAPPTVHRAAEAKRRARFAAKSTAPLGDKGGEKGGPEKGGPEKGGEGSASAHPSPRPSARPFANPSANPDVGPDESASPKENAKKRVVSGIKNVVVTPLSHEECTQLKAADALNNRRGYVAKKSDDQLAYIYLEDMEQMGEGASNSFDDFAAQFYPAIRKAGLIIDVRRNAGGNIDTWILERLRRVAWMFNTQRSGPGDTTMQYAFRGKVAVLVDEMTSSDAEIFAAGVQQLGLGAVVGARTWGGAVGYSSNPELALVDGSGFTIPSFGPYVSGKWMIEQRGVVPDIAVANDPVATFNGKDAQLDAAVAHLMALIEKEPKAAAIPAKPEYPDWSFDREVCRAGGDGGGRAREQRKGVLA
jgi:C-terminal processing protease CtpA/Prc/Tol biopolymer transport system component